MISLKTPKHGTGHPWILSVDRDGKSASTGHTIPGGWKSSVFHSKVAPSNPSYGTPFRLTNGCQPRRVQYFYFSLLYSWIHNLVLCQLGIFFFATPIEQILWRVCASYHAIFGVYGYTYYYTEIFKWHKAKMDSDKRCQYVEASPSETEEAVVMGEKTGHPVKNLTPVTATDIPPDSKDNTKADNSDIESQTQPASETSKDGYHAPYTPQWLPPMTIAGVLGFLRNNSANRDPQMRLS